MSVGVLGGGLALLFNIFLVGGDGGGVDSGEALALGTLGLVALKRFTQPFYMRYKQIRRGKSAQAALEHHQQALEHHQQALEHHWVKMIEAGEDTSAVERVLREEEVLDQLQEELSELEELSESTELEPLERKSLMLERKFLILRMILKDETGYKQLNRTFLLWSRGAIDQETTEEYLDDITRRFVGLSREDTSEQ